MGRDYAALAGQHGAFKHNIQGDLHIHTRQRAHSISLFQRPGKQLKAAHLVAAIEVSRTGLGIKQQIFLQTGAPLRCWRKAK